MEQSKEEQLHEDERASVEETRCDEKKSFFNKTSKYKKNLILLIVN